MTKYLTIVIFLSLIKCKEPMTNNTNDIIDSASTAYLSKDKEDYYYMKSINEGDKKIYGRLALFYQLNKKYDKLYSLSKIMADEHNNVLAMYMIYISYFDKYSVAHNNEKLLNEKLSVSEKEEIIYYLEKGAKIKNFSSFDFILKLEEMYRNGWIVEQNIKKADSLKSEINKK